MESQNLLTKEQLAERLAVKARTISAWMAYGRLSYCKINRAVRFTEAQVQEFLKRHTVKAVE